MNSAQRVQQRPSHSNVCTERDANIDGVTFKLSDSSQKGEEETPTTFLHVQVGVKTLKQF